MGGFNFLLLVVLVLALTPVERVVSMKSFNVKNYGARSNGRSDCTKALLSAWKDACTNPGGGMILVPSGTYLTAMLMFKGPCSGPITFKLDGVLLATNDLSKFARKNWVAFEFLKNFRLTGGGTFNAEGRSAWQKNKRTGKVFPTVSPIIIIKIIYIHITFFISLLSTWI